MLRYLYDRHSPEDNPPLGHRFSSLLSSFLCAYAPSALSLFGRTLAKQWHTYQAQPLYTAYRAVIQK